MFKYILKRIAYTIVTVFVLVTLTFFMMQLLPGDPFTGEKKIPDNVMASMKAKYGLDKPVTTQYILYVGNVLHGDFGVSLDDNRSVTDKLLTTFPVSFDLGIRALIFAVVVGILIGILAAVKRGTAWDSICMVIALLGVSVPSFIVAALLQYFFGLKLYQWTGVKFFPITGWNSWNCKILPVLAMGFGTIASVSRLMRTSMLDVLSSDYIKTAKAKGLSQAAIIWKHGVRNAILPVVTILGPTTASILTGGFVVESIFSIPGMGKSFVTSIQQVNYTMIMGTTIFYGTFLILCNLVVDLVYGLIDPRVKVTGGSK
jgi:oligopeptide transport system permease protein